MPYHVWKNGADNTMEKIGNFVEADTPENAILIREEERSVDPADMRGAVYFVQETTEESPGWLMRGKIARVRMEPLSG